MHVLRTHGGLSLRHTNLACKLGRLDKCIQPTSHQILWEKGKHEEPNIKEDRTKNRSPRLSLHQTLDAEHLLTWR